MSSVIKVEKLGKRYIIGHEESKQYTALRDVIVQKTKKIFSFSKQHNIYQKQEEFWALKDINFDVSQGDRIGIIGRNGAGKSTLLKILSRITEPTEGSIKIKGRVASLLEVGTGFHPELTGRENIFLNGAVLGMSRVEVKKKFDEIVDFSGIEKFLDTPVKRYSSGMYVRLAFAVAANLESDILIVDEVLAVGDSEFQKKCIGKMGEVSKGEGRTVLFVSHNMAAIEVFCKKVALLERGQLHFMGDTTITISKYLSIIIQNTQALILAEGAHNIRSFTILNAQGIETNSFGIGDDIYFEIDLFHTPLLVHPRLSIGIHSPSGERLVTIHSDIQQNTNWSFQGKKKLRAIWKNIRLVPATYRIDVSLWGYSFEVENLPGIKNIEIFSRDVYGTGVLPDPNFQGYLLADASWEIDAE